MKYYKLCFKQLFFQKLLKLTIVYFILYGMLILVSFLSNFEFDLFLFNTINGIPQDNTLFGFLWFLFQILFHIYVIYSFFVYDETNSFEFIVLRESYTKITRKKLLLILIIILTFRLLIFFMTYFIFFRQIAFPYIYLIINIFLYAIITFVVFFISYMVNKIKS